MAKRGKFKVGQVVRVIGGEKLRSFLPDYFRISSAKIMYGKWAYQVVDHEIRVPWVAQKQMRALTKREKGD